MAELIDGRAIANAILKKLPARVAKLGRKPGLGVILVGNDPASELYVRLKGRSAAECGINFSLQRFSADDHDQHVLKQVSIWNADPRIDAILVQVPLPKGFSEDDVMQAVDPEKDVDGFHPVNTGRFVSGERSHPPGLVEGIMRLISATGKSLTAASSAIVARESVFTTCLRHALEKAGSRPALALPDGSHRAVTLGADLLIVAAGRAGLIVGDDLKPGCTVIDVGINELPGGRITGDVDRASVGPVASWISPVPGGVGPMTIAMLLENTVRLAERNQA